MPATSTVKKLGSSRTQCTVTFDASAVTQAETKAIASLGTSVSLPGFRPGKAPADMVRSKIKPEAILEETIRMLLPETFESLMKEHNLKPIMAPKVEAMTKDPLTLAITFVEQPEVTLKNVNKIKIEKKEPKVDAKEVDRMVDYILKQHRTTKAVEREAKSGDEVTMDFWGEDESKKEIDGIRTTGHKVTIGSKVLIPGFEDALIGLRKGDEKAFTLIFPEKYHAEQLQGKPVTFHVTVQGIAEVAMPELTDAFAKANLQVESAAEFRSRIEGSMRDQENEIETQRREQELLEKIREATVVDLAPELLDDETRTVFEEWAKQLEKQNVSIETWLKNTKKTPEDMQKDMKARAEGRLKLRLGMQKLVEEKKVEISEEDMRKAIQEVLAPLPADERLSVAPAYAKGERAYEQLRWQKMVERVMDEMLA